MMACPSTRSEVRGALAKTVMCCTCILSFYPSRVFGPAIKVHPLPPGEAERWIVAYGLMQSAKNMCITVFEAAAAAAGARPVQRGCFTISTLRTMQVSVFYIADSY
jgi:hypothetical protein